MHIFAFLVQSRHIFFNFCLFCTEYAYFLLYIVGLIQLSWPNIVGLIFHFSLNCTEQAEYQNYASFVHTTHTFALLPILYKLFQFCVSDYFIQSVHNIAFLVQSRYIFYFLPIFYRVGIISTVHSITNATTSAQFYIMPTLYTLARQSKLCLLCIRHKFNIMPNSTKQAEIQYYVYSVESRQKFIIMLTLYIVYSNSKLCLLCTIIAKSCLLLTIQLQIHVCAYFSYSV